MLVLTLRETPRSHTRRWTGRVYSSSAKRALFTSPVHEAAIGSVSRLSRHYSYQANTQRFPPWTLLFYNTYTVYMYIHVNMPYYTTVYKRYRKNVRNAMSAMWLWSRHVRAYELVLPPRRWTVELMKTSQIKDVPVRYAWEGVHVSYAVHTERERERERYV